MSDPRYADKPMLMFLDSYVLDALGALDEASEERMASGVPMLRRALGAEGDTWQQIVESAMEMPPDSADALRDMWEQHVRDTVADGRKPDVLRWVHDLVDDRFA